MDAEVEGICGAGYGEVSPGRVNSRKRVPAPGVGHQSRDGRAGDPEAAAGHLLPGVAAGAAPPGRAGAGHGRGHQLPAGVSTRRVKKLAESLGVTKLSKSQVSLMAAELDGMVTSFRRGTAGPPPGLDAGHHLVSVRARRRRGGVRHWRRAGNARPGGAGRGARSGRGYIPGRERRALPVRHRRGLAAGVGVAMLTLRWWPLRQSQPAAALAA